MFPSAVIKRAIRRVWGGRSRRDLPPMFPGGMRIGREEEAAVVDVLRRQRLFRYYGPQSGPSEVDAFEEAFRQMVGARFGVAMSSGTSAIFSGLAALGVGPRQEVIVPAYTWISSAAAVVAAGAVPVVANIDASLTLDPDDVERRISPYTTAIMPVHMRGAPCRMDRLMDVANRHGLKVIEDVAQAAGGSFNGRRLGSIGDVGAFSFQFNKILTAGEGGMVVTSDQRLYERTLLHHDVAAAQRNGIPPEAEMPGLTLRMSELHGAVMRVQLTRLEGLLADMRRRKRQFRDAVSSVAARAGITLRTIHDQAGDTGLAMVFFAESPTRAKAIVQNLNAAGVPALVLHEPSRTDYHTCVHWTPIVAKRSWSSDGGPWKHHPRPIEYSEPACAPSLALLERAVHIDVNPNLTDTEFEYVTASTLRALR